MTLGKKDLLLIDLSERLPYGVKCQFEDESQLGGEKFYVDTLSTLYLHLFLTNEDFYIKPYLRPMSSMTEEEEKEYERLANRTIVNSVGFVHFEATELLDWLKKKMFDYRGMIGYGLANEVTDENNPYKC